MCIYPLCYLRTRLQNSSMTFSKSRFGSKQHLLGSFTFNKRELGPHNSCKLKSNTAAKRSTNS